MLRVRSVHVVVEAQPGCWSLKSPLCVVVLEAGRLVEAGSHAALVAGGGTYARLHASWMDASEAGEISLLGGPDGGPDLAQVPR